MTIWFASGNAHKKAELSAIFNAENSGIAVQIPADAGLEFDPAETGASFHENALLKARALRRLLLETSPGSITANSVIVANSNNHSAIGTVIVADDSGLCVDALGGRPGIYSARYAGAAAAPTAAKLSAAERNALLLAELGNAPNRAARFVCAMVALFDDGRFVLAQETLEGEIVRGQEYARGSGGFGYDPILYLPEYGKTVAELSEDEKNRVSHRGKAGRLLAQIVRGGCVPA